MADYDFKTLSPYDFEILCRDLLQQELGIRLETFKPGADSGIDIRGYTSASQPLIVQCKHYARSGIRKLIANIEDTEAAKLGTLNPSRYLLATSVPLSPGNKKTLLEALAPYCVRPDDILGQEDLNNLLARHPEIERENYKLWITSATVLHRVLHADSFLQSNMEYAEIERRLSLHVQTAATPKAWEILEADNFCLISGIPGIGKTTLAEILIVDLISRGHELIVVRSDIKEAFDRIDTTTPQVVYYDDFLGQASFSESLVKNEEQNLVRLLTLAKSHDYLKVILTTREYILAEAMQRYERLANSDIAMSKCIVDLSSYTRLDRARILYNHLHFFSMSRSDLEPLLGGDDYLRIVDHPNYNPRIIEWVVQAYTHDSETSLLNEFIANLDNPSRIWSHAFENQVTEDSRQLLYALATVPEPVSLEDLANIFHGLVDADVRAGETELQFLLALRKLDGTFVSSWKEKGHLYIEFNNPSIRDFILRRIGASKDLRRTLIEKAAFFEQLETLVELAPDGTRNADSVWAELGPKELARLAGRLFLTRSSRLVRIFIRSSREYEWYAATLKIGPRLRRLRSWMSGLPHQSAASSAITELSRQLVDNHSAKMNVDALCAIVRLVSDGGDNQELLEQICTRVLQKLRVNSPEMDDWREWGRLVQERPDLIGPIDQYRAEAVAAIDQWIESAREYCDNADDVDYYCDEIELIAEIYNVNVEAKLNTVKESLEDLEPSGPPPPDRRRSSIPDGRSTDDFEEEIRDLFASLRS